MDNLLSTVNFFVDDSSSVVNDSNISVNELNEDLQKISDNQWDNQWKMCFNPDLNKQANEVIFSRKLNKSSHRETFFNKNL